MKRCLSYALLLLLLSSPLVANAGNLTLSNTPTRVYFSPNGECTDAIVRELDEAKTEILVQAYSFTSKVIAKALVDAHKRNVHVEVILDKSNKTAKYSSLDFLSHAEIKTYVDSKHAIAHNKVMILDRQTVITGSFNFTTAAEEHNAENLLIIKSAELARLYIENWNKHREHSQVYMDRETKPEGSSDK